MKYIFPKNHDKHGQTLGKLQPFGKLQPLGRWKIETCHEQTNSKVDLSNEDHCGPCGQYALEKQKIIDKIKSP